MSLQWAQHQAHTVFPASRTASSSNPSATRKLSAVASSTTLKRRVCRRRHRKNASGSSASSFAVEARLVSKRRRYALLSLGGITCLSLVKEIYDFCQEDIAKYVRLVGFIIYARVISTLSSSQRFAVKRCRFMLSSPENIY